MSTQLAFCLDTGQTCEDSPMCDESELQILNPSTSSVEGFPVKILALLERVRGLVVRALDYGSNSRESLASYDLDLSSWKMSQRCLAGGLELFSETWPRSGLMRGGTAYQLQPSAPLTEEIGSSSWGTPRASGGGGDPEKRAARGFLEGQVVVWPTPTAKGNYNRKGISDRSGDGLRTTVQMWSTQTSGSLNPDWVEQLQGFPDGWTEVGPQDPENRKKNGKRCEPRKRARIDPND